MSRIYRLTYPASIEATTPTPIQPLPRLSQHLGGPTLYVKRDDMIGAGLGGNKSRKLAFLVAEALAQGCKRLVAYGDSQSNHCRQTALFAARYGLRCSLVLRGETPHQWLGNLLLNDLFGAQLHFAGKHSCEAVAETLVKQLRADRERPYLIRVGGSTGLGALGYVAAMEETLHQLREQQLQIDTMVFASGSGGTQAGLALGAALLGFRGRVLGISVDADAYTLTRWATDIAFDALPRVGKRMPADQVCIDVNEHYCGNGYGVVGEREREAIRLAARTEGLLLDPVYTGRAMGGLIDLIGKRAFTRRQHVLFWHTGGAAVLSAFASELSDRVVGGEDSTLW